MIVAFLTPLTLACTRYLRVYCHCLHHTQNVPALHLLKLNYVQLLLQGVFHFILFTRQLLDKSAKNSKGTIGSQGGAENHNGMQGSFSDLL